MSFCLSQESNHQKLFKGPIDKFFILELCLWVLQKWASNLNLNFTEMIFDTNVAILTLVT